MVVIVVILVSERCGAFSASRFSSIFRVSRQSLRVRPNDPNPISCIFRAHEFSGFTFACFRDIQKVLLAFTRIFGVSSFLKVFFWLLSK